MNLEYLLLLFINLCLRVRFNILSVLLYKVRIFCVWVINLCLQVRFNVLSSLLYEVRIFF